MENTPNIFHVKKFDVVNHRSAMKVNTDGVLLGALVTISPDDRSFLDIGTGTGTIALMVAQRSEAGRVDAIDIDEPSIEEAAMNFANSRWADRFQTQHASLDEFSQALECQYDVIVSNPPYFEDSLWAPQERRNNARHTATGLSYREIIEFAAQNLTQKGRLALVLPSETELGLTRHARMNGLHLHKITRVRTVPRKAPKRIIAEFARERCAEPVDTILTIQNEGQYTQEYLSLMKDFYLFA